MKIKILIQPLTSEIALPLLGFKDTTSGVSHPGRGINYTQGKKNQLMKLKKKIRVRVA